jgi:hypothetical protein
MQKQNLIHFISEDYENTDICAQWQFIKSPQKTKSAFEDSIR